MKEVGQAEASVHYWDRIKANKTLLSQLEGDNYQDSIKKFVDGNYKPLHLEKLHDYDNLYSIRIKGKEKANRLLFTWKEGTRDAYILGIVNNHNYQKSLRAIAFTLKNGLNEEDFVTLSDKSDNVTTTPPLPLFEQTVHYGGHLFSLSDSQYDVIQGGHRLPMIIEGTAGSGKTVIARQLLMAAAEEEGNTAYYFAPTPKLTTFMQQSIEELPKGKELLDNNRIIITTYKDYAITTLPTMQICGLEEFKSWYEQERPRTAQTSSSVANRDRKKSLSHGNTSLSVERMYSEMCIASVYSEEEYKALGEKQSSLSINQRDDVWNVLASYLARKGQESRCDPNLQALPIPEKEKCMVVVDEAQSSSAHALKFAKALAKDGQVLFVGDSSQSMLSSVSNTHFIKSLFYDETREESSIEVVLWPFSYRCPARVVQVSSALLAEKRHITKEKNPLRITENNTDTTKDGLCYFYDSSNGVSSFAGEVKNTLSTETVIIVPNDSLRAEAAELFGTEFVVTAKEFLGMGSPHVIMYRCFEKQASVALSAENGELDEAARIRVNELFVAMTRTEESLTICETDPRKNRDLFRTLGLEALHTASEAKKTALSFFCELKKSDSATWERKILELLQQGNKDVAKNLCRMLHKDDSTAAEQLFTALTVQATPPVTQKIAEPAATGADTANRPVDTSSKTNTLSSSASNKRPPVRKSAAGAVPSAQASKDIKASLLRAILNSNLKEVEAVLHRLPKNEVKNFKNQDDENYLYVAVKSYSYMFSKTPKENNARIIKALIESGIPCVTKNGYNIFIVIRSGPHCSDSLSW